MDLIYKPGDVLFESLPGSLDHWLLERYCMYSFLGKKLLRGDIHHDKWKVSKAKVTTLINTMTSFFPRIQYCENSKFTTLLKPKKGFRLSTKEGRRENKVVAAK